MNVDSGKARLKNFAVSSGCTFQDALVNYGLNRTRIPIGIDIGFGDVIYPDAVEMDFPVILDMEAPRVNAYSLEFSIAEKLKAIVKNGFLNNRYKDFYDIYVLSEKYPYLKHHLAMFISIKEAEWLSSYFTDPADQQSDPRLRPFSIRLICLGSTARSLASSSCIMPYSALASLTRQPIYASSRPECEEAELCSIFCHLSVL